MSKFNNILESHLSNTDLLRSRRKYDPANEEADLRAAKDYVGYVLKEDGEGGVIAIVPELGPEEVSISAGGFEPIQGDKICLLDEFKQHVINYLINKGFQREIGRYFKDIMKSQDVRDIEILLTKCSCDPSEVLNVYRDFISDAQIS